MNVLGIAAVLAKAGNGGLTASIVDIASNDVRSLRAKCNRGGAADP